LRSVAQLSDLRAETWLHRRRSCGSSGRRPGSRDSRRLRRRRRSVNEDVPRIGQLFEPILHLHALRFTVVLVENHHVAVQNPDIRPPNPRYGESVLILRIGLEEIDIVLSFLYAHELKLADGAGGRGRPPLVIEAFAKVDEEAFHGRFEGFEEAVFVRVEPGESLNRHRDRKRHE